MMNRILSSNQTLKQFKHFSNHSDPVAPIFPFGVGILAGTGGSLAGMGGAFIALPFLTGSFRLSQHMAHGTSMCCVLATGLGGCLGYSGDSILAFLSMNENTPNPTEKSLSKGIDWIAAAGLSISSSVMSIAGAKVCKSLSPTVLKSLLGVFLLLIAPVAPYREELSKGLTLKVSLPTFLAKQVESADPETLDKFATSFVIGSMSGFFAGLFGVGGGAIVVPALCIFTDIDYKVALGTSLAAMLPTAVTGCITHYRQGTLNPRIGMPIGLGCIAGSMVGGIVAKKLPEKEMKIGFAALMGVLSARYLHQAYKAIRAIR